MSERQRLEEEFNGLQLRALEEIRERSAISRVTKVALNRNQAAFESLERVDQEPDQIVVGA